MTFKVGETVVYPHHGAALIEAIETRVIKGEEKTYLVLKVAQGDLTVRVPADNVDLVGVRDVVDSAGLDRVFSVLRQPYTEEPTNWSRRYKANLEKLASGDVIKGEEKTYLVLKVAQGDLTVRVPADNVDLVGVRDVVDSAGLDRVFSVLRQPYTEEPTNWSRRYKANLEKLASGDVIKVAEVVRDLYRRDLDRGLSAGEKRMLAKAKQILVSELALAERTDEEKAAILLDEVLAS